MITTALVVLALASPHLGTVEPAYRVGSATNRVALLPVRCERDLDPSLCAALSESVAVEVARDPRLEVVNPRDIDVLLGAQTVADLSSCERDDCFARQDFTRVDASYLISLAVGRIGDEARLVVRIVDLKRGAVIDRDEGAAPARDERAIEQASKSLVMGVLVRRGLARPPADVDEDKGLSPVFWVGLGTAVVGVGAAGAGGFLGTQAFAQTRAITDNVDTLSRASFDQQASQARTTALGADLLMASGTAFLVAGGVMILVGAL
jgi:hypothetical protein